MRLIGGSFGEVQRRGCCVVEKLRSERARKILGWKKDVMQGFNY